MRPYLSPDWAGFRWSAWMPLMAAHPLALAQLPSYPGIYRVRRTDQPDRLAWIGWAPLGVRETIERLSRQVHLPVRPFDDPHHPALTLWTLRQAGAAFEVSGALVPAGRDGPAEEETLRRLYQELIEE